MTSEMDTQTSSIPLAIEDMDNVVILSNKTEETSELISEDMNWYLNIFLYIIVSGNITLFGTLSNICNIIVFYALGIKDSMSVCLFSLSISDFFVSFLILAGRVFWIWDIFFENEGVDPMAERYIVIAWSVGVMYLCSGWTLTFLSLERCVCVTFPFKVKQIFTINRSIVAVVIIFVIIIGTHVPIYMTQQLGWTSENIGTDNVTRTINRLVVVFSENRQEVETYVSLFSSTVEPVPALVLTLGSVLWMIYGLKVSTKFRQSMSATGNTATDKERQDYNAMRKTRRLIKVVLTLAIIFCMCSIPHMLANYIYVIYPAMSEGGKEKNLNNLVWQCALLSYCINASVNIFVYLKINTSYQVKFREIFLKHKRVDQID